MSTYKKFTSHLIHGHFHNFYPKMKIFIKWSIKNSIPRIFSSISFTYSSMNYEWKFAPNGIMHTQISTIGWIITKGIMYNCKGGHVMNPNPCKQCFDTDRHVNTHYVYPMKFRHLLFGVQLWCQRQKYPSLTYTTKSYIKLTTLYTFKHVAWRQKGSHETNISLYLQTTQLLWSSLLCNRHKS